MPVSSAQSHLYLFPYRQLLSKEDQTVYLIQGQVDLALQRPTGKGA
jgi:hypothetical protein